jgi:hypothetical protein
VDLAKIYYIHVTMKDHFFAQTFTNIDNDYIVILKSFQTISSINYDFMKQNMQNILVMQQLGFFFLGGGLISINSPTKKFLEMGFPDLTYFLLDIFVCTCVTSFLCGGLYEALRHLFTLQCTHAQNGLYRINFMSFQ